MLSLDTEDIAAARQLHVLVVEDDDNHAEIMRRALRRSEIVASFDRVTDGAEALAYLRRQRNFTGRQIPDIVLLDLKLPKIDGHEVLSVIKQDPRLQSIPVVVLSTSDAEQDRAKAYRRHANSYLVKPFNYEQFREMVNDICLYWGAINNPPPKNPPSDDAIAKRK